MGLVAAIFLVIEVVYDFRERRVPNWLVLGMLAWGVVLLVAGRPMVPIGWTDAVLGIVLGFGMLVFYRARLMGAGDVKFAAALGLWLGWQGLGMAWLLASVLAALHALAWLSWERYGVQLGWPPSAGAALRARQIPYAAYLALATLGYLLSLA